MLFLFYSNLIFSSNLTCSAMKLEFLVPVVQFQMFHFILAHLKHSQSTQCLCMNIRMKKTVEQEKCGLN